MGVVYSYSIRIVLGRNTSIDVSIPLTGSFQLSKHCITVTVFDYETVCIIIHINLFPSNNLEQMFTIYNTDAQFTSPCTVDSH